MDRAGRPDRSVVRRQRLDRRAGVDPAAEAGDGEVRPVGPPLEGHRPGQCLQRPDVAVDAEPQRAPGEGASTAEGQGARARDRAADGRPSRPSPRPCRRGSRRRRRASGATAAPAPSAGQGARTHRRERRVGVGHRIRPAAARRRRASRPGSAAGRRATGRTRVEPSTTRSASTSPTTGVNLKPCPEKPHASSTRSVAGCAPMTKFSSGVSVYQHSASRRWSFPSAGKTSASVEATSPASRSRPAGPRRSARRP